MLYGVIEPKGNRNLCARHAKSWNLQLQAYEKLESPAPGALLARESVPGDAGGLRDEGVLYGVVEPKGNRNLCARLNQGACCHTKCDNPHKWAGFTLTYSNCQVIEGKYEIDGKTMATEDLIFNGFDLPDSSYVCREVCDIEGYNHRHSGVTVFRSGGDKSSQPVCAFIHLR
ncbi:unnamed protein product [Symbiodinium natans]|uniref:Uncharacterized protein n=1 Tax=Symbiodinium natans TaxID=878477 RepID=A0A812RQB3_9DINO|nr:unnamed protein product [Symbiodinium natans]